MGAFVVAPGHRIHLGGGVFAVEGDPIDLGPADAARLAAALVPVVEIEPAPKPAPAPAAAKPSRRAAAQPEG
jgi:hypothetical protein